MDYLISIILEVFKFVKEKGYVEELLDWAEAQAADTESPLDDTAVKILRFFIS